MLWHQLFQEKNLSRPIEAGWVPKKVLMCAFPYHPFTHVIFMAYPKSWRDMLSNKIQAYTTCDNFPLNTPWLCNAILMYCFCNRVWVPFSRLLNRWQGKVIYMSSAANPIWGLEKKMWKDTATWQNPLLAFNPDSDAELNHEHSCMCLWENTLPSSSSETDH